MRQKTIREAIMVVTLGTFLFTSAPAAARSGNSTPWPAQASAVTLSLFEGWISTWAQAWLTRSARPAEFENQAKTATAPPPPSASSESGSGNYDRSAAIDPLGRK